MKTIEGKEAVFIYENAIVLRVVDGDSLWALVDQGDRDFSEMNVRLAGIDTPEIFRPSCDAEREHGLEAKAYLEWLIPAGTQVRLITEKPRDKYGRYHARVETYRDGVTCDVTSLMSKFQKRDDYLQQPNEESK